MEYTQWIDNVLGKDSVEYRDILERILKEFKERRVFYRDVRLVQLWLEYAELCHDKENIYDYMETNGLGDRDANFYVYFGQFFESRQDYTLANEIYLRGIKKDALPKSQIKDALNKFEKKMIEKIETEFSEEFPKFQQSGQKRKS